MKRSPHSSLLQLGTLTALLVLAAPSAQAHPHLTAPPVDLTISVRGEEVMGVLVVDKWQVAQWGMPPGTQPNLRADIPADDLVRRLNTRFEVELDGALVTPVLRKVTEPSKGATELMVPTLRIVLDYPVKKAPTRIVVRWKDFQGILWENKVEAALQIEAQGNVDAKELTPAEPEYQWHARPPAAFRAAPPPLPQPPGGSRLPLAAIMLALLALTAPFLPGLRRQSRGVRWLPAVGLLGVAGVLLARGVGEVGSPWGAAQPPTEAQARTITTTLLQNVYRAFDADSERGIYDLLAASVERGLLDGLYADVYESLVLREQGGAVCRVADVSFGEGRVRFAENGAPTQFENEQAWQVRGAVTHYGHPHERVTLYRARLTLRHAEASWRIASIEMLEHKRIDEGKPAAPGSAPGAAPAANGAGEPEKPR